MSRNVKKSPNYLCFLTSRGAEIRSLDRYQIRCERKYFQLVTERKKA